MKKNLNKILPIIIMFIVAILCIVMYLIFTGNIQYQKNNSVEQQIAIPDNNYDIILTKQELPRLDASIATQKLMTAIVRDFAQDENIQGSELNYSNEEEGYEKLINGQIDILLATEPTEEIITLSKAKGVELELYPIAKEAFVFYVNKNNQVDSLKISDIQKIYTSQVTDWSQIGGKRGQIIAFQRTENSNNQREMEKSVMKNLKMADAPKDVFYDKTYGKIDDLVASYDNSENAIGYSYLYDAKTMYDTEENADNTIKFLKINDIEPNYENIKNEKYPLRTNYYIVKLKNNNSEVVDIFMEAIKSERTKLVIKEAGYIDN